MKQKYYIGLDVHKESIAIAYTWARSRSAPTYHGQCGGSNLSAERALRALAKKLGVPFNVEVLLRQTGGAAPTAG